MSGNLNMKFLYAGIALAILISFLAPFLASPDPDGLESAAGGIIEESKMAKIEESEPVVGSLMPDYSIEGMGKTGEVLAITVGTVAVLIFSFGLGKVLNKET